MTPRGRRPQRRGLREHRIACEEGDIDRVLIVPGWTGSGPEHWQTLWERENSAYRRIEMPDWERPDPDAWEAALDAAVGGGPPPVLVAHSLGCVAVVRWAAAAGRGRVRAALLVAPPDVERDDAPPEIDGFAPIPTERLPFPAVLVASRTDPWTAFDRAREWARAWGAEIVDAGDAGHLNTDAGFGPWPEGERLLAGLTSVHDS